MALKSEDLAHLLVVEQKLVPAQKTSPNEWKRWWTVCLIGMLVFAILVFTMRGRWSPRAAWRDLAEHERMVTEELTKMDRETPPRCRSRPGRPPGRLGRPEQLVSSQVAAGVTALGQRGGLDAL